MKVKKTTFKGTSLPTFYGMLYLLNKYKNIAFPVSKKIINFDINNIRHTQISFMCNYINKSRYSVKRDFTLKFPAKSPTEINFFNLVKKFETNPKIDFLVCLIYISHDCLNKTAHNNMIIFDLNRKEVERFEPHGVKNYGYKSSPIYNELDRQLKKIFHKYKYIYLPPKTFCPYIGPQTKETIYDGLKLQQNTGSQSSTSNTNTILPTDPYGFCAAWSIWYADIRMKNPKVERNKLIKQAIELIKNKPFKFRQFIRNYAEFIIQQQNKLNFKSSNSLLDY